MVFLLVIVVYCVMEFCGFFLCSDWLFINMIYVFCGILIFVLMVVCFLLRLKYLILLIIFKLKLMMMGLVYLGYLVIYFLFIVLLVIGLVMMYNWGNLWFVFGLMMFYVLEVNFEWVDSLKLWYEMLVNLGYFVIGLYVVVVLVYYYFWKDNIFLCMMLCKCFWRIFKENVCIKIDLWYRWRIWVYIGSVYYIYLYDK